MSLWSRGGSVRRHVFGPIIEGAAYEFRAPSLPTHIGTFDGYLTIAFGAPHFHICIGEHKGAPSNPASPALARHRRTLRAELYRRLDCSGAPVSWGLRLFNGEGEQQITVLTRHAAKQNSTSKRRTPMHPQFHAIAIGWRRPIWIAFAGRRQRCVHSRLCLRDAARGFRRRRSSDHDPPRRLASHRPGLARQPMRRVRRAALSVDGGLSRLGRRSRHCCAAFGEKPYDIALPQGPKGAFMSSLQASQRPSTSWKRCCFVASENDRAAVRRNGFAPPARLRSVFIGGAKGSCPDPPWLARGDTGTSTAIAATPHPRAVQSAGGGGQKSSQILFHSSSV